MSNTTLNAHIDQLADMKNYYPEAKQHVNQLITHLKGLKGLEGFQREIPKEIQKQRQHAN